MLDLAPDTSTNRLRHSYVIEPLTPEPSQSGHANLDHCSRQTAFRIDPPTPPPAATSRLKRLPPSGDGLDALNCGVPDAPSLNRWYGVLFLNRGAHHTHLPAQPIPWTSLRKL
jgi:hypothetical protein